ncbi:MAG: non-homologous end-joining DNA ligase [Acidimicrobiales bacterium]
MRAVVGALPDDDDGWAYELKWDGVRAVATVHEGRLRLTSSSGADVTARYPELAPLAARLADHDAVLDGEIVALDPDGVPSFGRLQPRMHADPAKAARLAADEPVTLELFDLLWLDGNDATPLPYEDRRRLLEALVEAGPTWQVPAASRGDGRALLEAVADRGLEGLVAKRLGSRYEPGHRSGAWRKLKVRRRQELVVGGFTPGTGARAATFGALVVGYHEPPRPRGATDVAPGPLRFAGKVGSGFTDEDLARLRRMLDERVEPACPFAPPPDRAVVRHATWVRPELVVEVAFTEWSHEDHLRHPVHLGQRDDRDPAEVGREPDPPTAPRLR